MNTKRNQKDTVYRMLFRKPENALSLYNGLNGTDYKDVSKLEFNTLENAIYMGMNEKLKEKCPALKEYVTYVETIRNYANAMPLKEAVEQAVEECIENNILREFLRKQRAEVVKMSIYEYDEEREMRLIREDEREIGKEIGREEERKNTENERRRAETERARAEQEKENTIKSVVSLCKEFGSTKEQAVNKVMENCSLGKKIAEEKVESYWKYDIIHPMT